MIALIFMSTAAVFGPVVCNELLHSGADYLLLHVILEAHWQFFGNRCLRRPSISRRHFFEEVFH
jgi:hypothetical protein